MSRRALEESSARAGELTGDVEEASHVAGVAPGGFGAFVDVAVHGREVRDPARQVGERRDSAVTHPARGAQDAGFVRADPHPGAVGRCKATLGIAHGMVDALDGQAIRLRRLPETADDRDRLLERHDRLPWAEPTPAHRLDRVPGRAGGSDAELDPASEEHVRGGDAAREQSREAQRQVGDVGGEVDAISPPRGGGSLRVEPISAPARGRVKDPRWGRRGGTGR